MSATSNVINLSERLNRQIVTWCGVNSLLYTDGKLNWTPAPISIFPKRLARKDFEYLKEVQTVWNKLIDKIARDRDFLRKELRFVCDADPFTARLMKIYESLSEEEIRGSFQLGVLRSDYMLDASQQRALQIEINTISSSFGSLSKRVNMLQDYLLQRNSEDEEVVALLKEVYGALPATPSVEHHDSLKNIAAGLAAAHKVYSEAHGSASEGVVAFIVQPKERNLADQRLLELEVWQNHHVACEFVTLSDVAERGRVNERGQLLLKHTLTSQERVVSVAYYRAGYTPDDYSEEKQWTARELVERSDAIKCPSVGYHLAGCKAVQAALFKPDVVELFLSAEESQVIRQSFAEQYSLGDHELATRLPDIIQQAIDDEGRSWVLKPQREGGGNNYYGAHLKDFLLQHRGQPVLEGFVLMRRIFPALQASTFFKQGELAVAPSISELGIYGTCLFGGNGKEVLNSFAGYLLRTKAEGVDEGGVATGYSVLDAVTLVD
eukprot:gene12805-14033_t